MSAKKRLAVVALCLAVAGSAWLPRLMTAAEPAATAPAARPMPEIAKDLAAADNELKEVMPSLLSIAKADFRKNNGAKVIPPLKKIAGLLHEVATTQNIPDADMRRNQFLMFLVALGDEDSTKTLQTAADDKKDASMALDARSALALGNWIKNSDNPAGQQKVLDDYAAIAKANPSDATVAGTLITMVQLAPANADMSKKTIELIRGTIKGDGATEVFAQLDAIDARNGMVGSPLVVEGRTSTGGHLSTADWKGKVVLVDFWATWCGPCKESIPEVKGVFKKYHDKGFEIVGVDCDMNDSAVNQFTGENEMTWPQLHDEDAQSKSEETMWHPLTKKYHVDAIPAMFLIDKKGVLRSVDGRDDLEQKVKELLEEKDGPATQPAAK